MAGRAAAGGDLDAHRQRPAVVDQVAAVERVVSSRLHLAAAPTWPAPGACIRPASATSHRYSHSVHEYGAVRPEQVGVAPGGAAVGADLDAADRLLAGPGHAEHAVGAHAQHRRPAAAG